jgi:lycopene cyclase domain-containing protein
MNIISKIVIAGITLATLLLVIFNIKSQSISQNNFIYSLPNAFPIVVFETQFLYFILLGFTLIPVVALSFDTKVNYVSKWKFLIKGILLVACFFILWDFVKTYLQVWGFNSTYTIGLKLYNLPIEECLFFVVVPFSCVFIYECLLCYFPNDRLLIIEPIITNVLIGILYATAIMNWDKVYTATTCIIAGSILLMHFVLFLGTIRSRFYSALIVCVFPFLLVDGALTGAFQHSAVVIYNPEEFLNLRILTIPIEDFIYFIPLYLLNVTMFESERNSELLIVRKRYEA